MTKIILILSLSFTFALAAPLELEGGALYVEASDTTLTFEAPDDGVVFIGCEIGGYSLGDGFYLLIDQDTIALPVGGNANAAQGSTIVSISPGTHHFHMMFAPYGGTRTISSSRIWVLFWPKKTVAVAEPGEQPGIPPVAFLALLCRAGTPIQVSLPSSAVYDASGKLVERPGGEWIPASTGTYFIKGEKQTQKVVVVK